MANRVFEDRVGLWFVDGDRGCSRLPAVKAFAGGLIRDVFLPRTATPAHFAAVRNAGLYAHLWVAVDGRDAPTMVANTLADVARLRPGAVELNIELGSDAGLKVFVIEVVKGIRAKRKNLRLRLNVGAWKAFGLPRFALERDPNLYACMQTYLGAMEPVSAGDCYHELLGYGVPESKLTLCYGAAGPVPPNGERVCTLPDLARRRRGVIFHDELMADVGLL
jgi:hypothetical protein